MGTAVPRLHRSLSQTDFRRQMPKTVILSFARTAVGKLGGGLARLDATVPTAPNTRTPTRSTALRTSSLGRKQSLAIREFAVGAEAVERFVRRDPLYRVHECVFAVLRSRAKQWTRACSAGFMPLGNVAEHAAGHRRGASTRRALTAGTTACSPVRPGGTGPSAHWCACREFLASSPGTRLRRRSRASRSLRQPA